MTVGAAVAVRGGADAQLPTTRTCFDALALPAHLRKAALRERLLFAVHHCVALDTA